MFWLRKWIRLCRHFKVVTVYWKQLYINDLYPLVSWDFPIFFCYFFFFKDQVLSLQMSSQHPEQWSCWLPFFRNMLCFLIPLPAPRPGNQTLPDSSSKRAWARSFSLAFSFCHCPLPHENVNVVLPTPSPQTLSSQEMGWKGNHLCLTAMKDYWEPVRRKRPGDWPQWVLSQSVVPIRQSQEGAGYHWPPTLWIPIT